MMVVKLKLTLGFYLRYTPAEVCERHTSRRKMHPKANHNVQVLPGTHTLSWVTEIQLLSQREQARSSVLVPAALAPQTEKLPSF